MCTPDYLRARLNQMLILAAIEVVIAPKIAHKSKLAKSVIGADLAGAFDGEFGGGISPTGRLRLLVRLMISLLYLKNSFNLSDEALLERRAKDVQCQFFRGTLRNKAIAHALTQWTMGCWRSRAPKGGECG